MSAHRARKCRRSQAAQSGADKIIWPCKRLGVPPAFVAQWIRNHLPRLLLGTLSPEGKGELFEINRLVLAAFGLPSGPVRNFPARPRFI